MQAFAITPKKITLYTAVLAMAALVVTVLAVSFAAGPAQAQNKDGTTTHATPEPCADSPKKVVSSGYVALFDVSWDAEDENLVENPCPPTVKQTVETKIVNRQPVTETVTTRTASNIDIRETIIHVPDTARHTLTAADSDPWDVDDYEFLGDADDVVWVVPSCEPGATPAAGPLCIFFSTGLLNADHWDNKVQYEFESIREEEDLPPDDQGQIYVFYDHDDVPAGEEQPIWRTDDADSNEIQMEPGEYITRNWAFTKPGTYDLQVHLKGHPEDSLAEAKTVTSVVTPYRIHVGKLADVGVAVTADNASPAPGDTVTYTVTASNAGPDPAPKAEVNLSLPQGLTYVSSTPATTANDDGARTWAISNLAATGPQELTLTATVNDGTRGQALAMKASIVAKDTIGGTEVAELDPFDANNSASVTVTPAATMNRPAVFQVVRSVKETATGGTNVSDPVSVLNPDGDTLTFGLEGEGSDKFTVSAVDGGAQVALAAGTSRLYYALQESYDLTLTVSDGKDKAGNADTAVDDRLALRINVTDVDEGEFSVTLSANPTTQSVGNTITLTATVNNPPVPTDMLHYRFGHRIEGQAHGGSESSSGPTLEIGAEQDTHGTYRAGTYRYDVAVWYLRDGKVTGEITSQEITVTWTGGS